jgi:6-phosphogluconolactonase
MDTPQAYGGLKMRMNLLTDITCGATPGSTWQTIQGSAYSKNLFMEVKIYHSRLEVAQRFSEFLSGLIASRERAHIALSGGSTPLVVFEELAAHYREAIPWSIVHLYWGDERCVPPDHPDSNFRMTNEHLLSHIDIPPQNIHRIHGEEEPEQEALRYGDLLKKNVPPKYRLPHFDLVMLGLGEDGHTASVFPQQMALWDSRSYCEVATHPESGQRRVTLTGKIINNAANVAFLATGAGKAEKVREILREKGEFNNYPASRVAPRSGELYWFLDKEAARGVI